MWRRTRWRTRSLDGPTAQVPGAGLLSRWAVLVALTLVAGLAGCATGSGGHGVSRGELERLFRSRGLDPAAVVVPYEVGEEARAWLDAAVPRRGVASRHLEALLASLVGEDELGILYQRGFTGTADEVFAARRANCLGFMNLFVGLARALGYPVYYVAVEEGETYGREGDLVVVADHIAAGYGPPYEMLLLDFVVGPPIEYEKLHPISDVEAVAKFYSNRGAESLLDGAAREAVRWLEIAVALEPELAATWVNLGVARRRTGDLAGAEAAYHRALELEPRTASAYRNLAAILRLRGQEAEALQLLAITKQLGSRNPYNYLSLGDWSLEAGRVEEARRFYRRALALKPQDAEPYAALGQLEWQRGDARRARRYLRKALRRDSGDRRTRELAELVEGGGAP